MKRLNRNNKSFLILAVIHTSLLIAAFIRSNDRKRSFISLMSDIGFAYLFEYIVLNLFNAYKYKPKILRNNYLDNILGAILSQAIFVPFTSQFIRTFKLGWVGKLFFIVYFYLVEQYFIQTKVYSTLWWKSYFTSFFLPVFYNLSDYWKNHLEKGTRFILFISLFLSILVTGVNILYVMAVVRKFRFGLGKIHSWKEHFILAPLYSILLSLLSAITVKKGGLIPKGVFLVFASFLDWVIHETKVVKKRFHVSTLNIFIHCLMLYISTLFKNLIYSENNQQS
ncbi:hypothetical protein ACFYKX_03035 [Cytobacillus sp. FJAT-54145]|uniref:Uncharacterized protein n=1 Tax=Cytobacillus spartinae TaxID=3299023 RepID=A0ABW6K788_9BACI